MFHLLYIRSIIKLWGKGKKVAGKYSSLYIEYIIKEYIRVNKGMVRKWREKGKGGKSVPLFCI